MKSFILIIVFALSTLYSPYSFAQESVEPGGIVKCKVKGKVPRSLRKFSATSNSILFSEQLGVTQADFKITHSQESANGDVSTADLDVLIGPLFSFDEFISGDRVIIESLNSPVSLKRTKANGDTEEVQNISDDESERALRGRIVVKSFTDSTVSGKMRVLFLKSKRELVSGIIGDRVKTVKKSKKIIFTCTFSDVPYSN